MVRKEGGEELMKTGEERREEVDLITMREVEKIMNMEIKN